MKLRPAAPAMGKSGNSALYWTLEFLVRWLHAEAQQKERIVFRLACLTLGIEEWMLWVLLLQVLCDVPGLHQTLLTDVKNRHLEQNVRPQHKRLCAERRTCTADQPDLSKVKPCRMA